MNIRSKIGILLILPFVMASCVIRQNSSNSTDNSETNTSTKDDSSSTTVASYHSLTFVNGEGYSFEGPSKIKEGEEVIFLLIYQDGFEGGEVTSTSGNVVKKDEGTYVLSGVKENATISASGVAVRTLKISFPSGAHYAITGEASSPYGLPYSFSVAFDLGYTGIVKLNGETIELASDGSYCVPVLRHDLYLTIENVIYSTFHLSLPEGEGYLLSSNKEEVLHGEEVQFTFTVKEDYLGGVVYVDGEEVLRGSGSFVLPRLTKNPNIEVKKIDRLFTLNYSSSPEYSITGPASAHLGEEVKLSVTFTSDAIGGRVKAGDLVLEKNEDGTYSIPSMGLAYVNVVVDRLEKRIAPYACDFYSADSRDFKPVEEQTEQPYKFTPYAAKDYAKVYSLKSNDHGSGPNKAPKSLQPIVLNQYESLRFAFASRWGTMSVKNLYDDKVICHGRMDESQEPIWDEVALKREESGYAIYVNDVKTEHSLPLNGSLADLFFMPDNGWEYIFVSELIGMRIEESNPYAKMTDSPFAAISGVSDSSVSSPSPFIGSVRRFDDVNWTASGYDFVDLSLADYSELIFQLRYVNDDVFTYFEFFLNKSQILTSIAVIGGHWHTIRLSKNSDGWCLSGGGARFQKGMQIDNLNKLSFRPVNGVYPFYATELIARGK